MHSNTMRMFLMILLTPAVGAANYAPSQLPMPQHYVEDYANVIQPDHEHALNSLLQELEQKTGTQYIVLTVPTTGGTPIDQYSLQVARDNWKLGQQDKDNGMLFVIAVSDRKYWFTPGVGLEGFLTDSYLSDLGRNILTPRLQQGRYSEGIHAVNLALIRRIAGQAGVTLAGLPGLPQGSSARRESSRGVSQRPTPPVRSRSVPSRGRSLQPGIPCCALLFLGLPLLPLALIGGFGAGRQDGTGGAFSPLMFHGLHSHHLHSGHGHSSFWGGGPFGGGFGGFGGGMRHGTGSSMGGGHGHFGGGGGGHFSGRGAGGGW